MKQEPEYYNNISTQSKPSVKKKIWDLLQGEFLWKYLNPRFTNWIIAIAILLFFMVEFNYSHMRMIREIANLNKEINELRMEYVSTSTQLMGARRLSEVERKVHSNHLDLSIPSSIPYVIEP